MNIIKILEKIIIIIMIIMISGCVCYIEPCYADSPIHPDSGGGSNTGNVSGNTNKGLPSLDDNYKPKASNGKPIEIVEKILGVLTIIGVIAMVIAVAVMGFGLILGSASDKALKQEQMVGLLIAAALITGGSLIARIIISAAESM